LFVHGVRLRIASISSSKIEAALKLEIYSFPHQSRPQNLHASFPDFRHFPLKRLLNGFLLFGDSTLPSAVREFYFQTAEAAKFHSAGSHGKGLQK
jgi:hypothetical protein